MMENKYVVIGAGVAALGLLYLVKRPGAASDAGAAIGGAVVDTAGGVVTGVVTGISDAIGLPTPAETITDAAECKLYMDQNGVWAASAKCGLPAFVEALAM